MGACRTARQWQKESQTQRVLNSPEALAASRTVSETKREKGRWVEVYADLDAAWSSRLPGGATSLCLCEQNFARCISGLPQGSQWTRTFTLTTYMLYVDATSGAAA